jgi:4-amino-4-deoxy-L-arabinose transferase-like glycosyltransferase
MTKFSNTYEKATMILVAFFVLVHLILNTSVGLGVDEAHYGLFALNLDWSYFDHPPMVGWLLALGIPFGLGDITLRVIPTLIMGINSALLIQLSRQLFPNDPRTVFFSLGLFHLGLISQLLGWGMVPDVPLMTWNLLIVLVAFKLYENFSWRYWIAFGILVGLSGLTKYTAIVIPIALLAWLIIEKRLVNWLSQPGLWAAVVIAGILILPVIYWNAINDWVSLDYQFNHGTDGEWEIANLLQMLLVQFATYSPVLFILGVIYLISRTTQTGNYKSRLVLSMALTHLALVAWSSGNGEILPHWAALGWLFMAPLAASIIPMLWKSLAGKATLIILGSLSIILVLALYILLAFKPVALIPGVNKAYTDIMGWKEAAAKAQDLANENDVDFLWVENWTHTSRIAWYAYPAPVQVIDDQINQFDLWHGEPEAKSTAILITTKDREQNYAPLLGNQCHLLDSYIFKIDDIKINGFWFYLCAQETATKQSVTPLIEGNL